MPADPGLDGQHFPIRPGAFTPRAIVRLFKEPDELRRVTVVGPWCAFVFSVDSPWGEIPPYEGRPWYFGQHFMASTEAVDQMLQSLPEEVAAVNEATHGEHADYYMEIEWFDAVQE